MTEVIHLHVVLELGEDNIRGSVDDGTLPAVAFGGWLELMSAFDTIRARARATGELATTDPMTHTS
jgi:hypothetical protein